MNHNEARSAKFRERCRSEDGYQHPVADFLALRTLSWPETNYVHRDSARQVIVHVAPEVDRDIERERKYRTGARAWEERRGSSGQEPSSSSNRDEGRVSRKGALGVPDVLQTVSETDLPSKRISVSKHSKNQHPRTMITRRNSGKTITQTSFKNGHSENSEYNRDIKTSIVKPDGKQSQKSRKSSRVNDNGLKHPSDKNVSIKKPSKSVDGNQTSKVSRSARIHKKRHNQSIAQNGIKTSKSAIESKAPIPSESAPGRDFRFTVSLPPPTCTKKRLQIAIGLGVSVLSLSLIVATVVATQFNSSADSYQDSYGNATSMAFSPKTTPSTPPNASPSDNITKMSVHNIRQSILSSSSSTLSEAEAVSTSLSTSSSSSFESSSVSYSPSLSSSYSSQPLRASVVSSSSSFSTAAPAAAVTAEAVSSLSSSFLILSSDSISSSTVSLSATSKISSSLSSSITSVSSSLILSSSVPSSLSSTVPSSLSSTVPSSLSSSVPSSLSSSPSPLSPFKKSSLLAVLKKYHSFSSSSSAAATPSSTLTSSLSSSSLPPREKQTVSTTSVEKESATVSDMLLSDPLSKSKLKLHIKRYLSKTSSTDSLSSGPVLSSLLTSTSPSSSPSLEQLPNDQESLTNASLFTPGSPPKSKKKSVPHPHKKFHDSTDSDEFGIMIPVTDQQLNTILISTPQKTIKLTKGRIMTPPSLNDPDIQMYAHNAEVVCKVAPRAEVRTIIQSIEIEHVPSKRSIFQPANNLTGSHCSKVTLLGRDSVDACIYRKSSSIELSLRLRDMDCRYGGHYRCLVTTDAGSGFYTLANLDYTEPPTTPRLDIPVDLVERWEASTPVSCHGNVGLPERTLQLHIKPKGSTAFVKIEGLTTASAGLCGQNTTASVIYTPTRGANGSTLKCVVVGKGDGLILQESPEIKLTILPNDLCKNVTNGRRISHPVTCTKHIRCVQGMYQIGQCPDDMCFDETKDVCGTNSLSMSNVVANLNEGVTSLKCRLNHVGGWQTITISKLANDDRVAFDVITATNGKSDVTVHNSTLKGRVFAHVDASRRYEVEVSLWIYVLACGDEGTYTCSVDRELAITPAVGNIQLQVKPEVPTLSVPIVILEGALLSNPFQCEANVGYPPGDLVLLVKTPEHPVFREVVENVTSHTKQSNCSIRMLKSYTFLPNLSHNGVTIQCAVTNNMTMRTDNSLVDMATVHVVPGNFCAVHGTRTPHVHPYDCHQYVQCTRTQTYVQRCGSKHCFNPETLMCDGPIEEANKVDPSKPCLPDKTGVFFPHPVLCNKFIWCVRGIEVIQHCPMGTLYLDKGQCTFEPGLSMCYMKHGNPASR